MKRASVRRPERSDMPDTAPVRGAVSEKGE
ncbi:hypothetical protein H4W34_004280 [Actinomadura algeriensis]|uniref:Uncharacterized protein n=1 Tax=Actinomadura algeriensis TaxID=1679523 RepID=A0ABR9JV68_9ACTN|nr:hypothetical protein [Actinomadura algeriensis]